MTKTKDQIDPAAVSDFRAETQYNFFCRSRLQNLAGQLGASIAVVALTWSMANQGTLIIYLIINQILVLLTGIAFYSSWTHRNRTHDGIPKFAIELGIIRQTFLGSLFWLDIEATRNLTFVLAVLVVLCGCLLGTIVMLGPLKRMARHSLTCLFLPAALACLYAGHTVMGVAILFFIYVVAMRGVRQVSVAYDELISLREESAKTAMSLESNNKKLLLANQNLEDEMNRRTLIEADRAKLQAELVEASRQAGKAEVATGVLHNVGNVMNSVNVTTCILHEDLQKKLLARLNASIDLLTDHESDLPDFFSTDERAKYFIPFLQQLSSQTGSMVEEFDKLLSNIKHVNDVVASQQSYAMKGAFTVKVDTTSIVESAIQITEERFRKSDIRVETKFRFFAELLIDKSKLLQVLVNILRNAANSVAESENENRLVSISVEQIEEQLEISIEDTGIGIAPEKFDKIFQHGFSTWTASKGHGFGLHHSANAIREMGGVLIVNSPGEMQGATFTIQLPLPKDNFTAPAETTMNQMA